MKKAKQKPPREKTRITCEKDRRANVVVLSEIVSTVLKEEKLEQIIHKSEGDGLLRV